MITLKDLVIGCKYCLGEFVNAKKLKEEAIKWVKEDMEEQGSDIEGLFMQPMIVRWMDRLNITKEDLK